MTRSLVGLPERKTMMVTQDMFPGAWIEPRWTRPDAIKFAPFYAIMLSLGASVIHAPQGQVDFVTITFEGVEHTLHRDNFYLSHSLAQKFIDSFLIPKGYEPSNPGLRFQPLLLLNGLKELMHMAEFRLEIPVEKTRMIWVLPDDGACGEYRSQKPFQYMNAAHAEDFYTERLDAINFAALPWYDAIIAHRVLPKTMLAFFQQMKTQSGKTLVFEYDDDFFNIPEWNHNKEKIGPQELERFKTAMDCADIIIASTQNLVGVSSQPDKTFFGPNLVNIAEFGQPLQCSRVLQGEFDGYMPQYKNNQLKWVHQSRSTITELDQQKYNPIRILWAGSNTHDEDLEQVIPAIVKSGEKHGIAVQFIFFGYLPKVFAEVITKAGYTQSRLVVKERYQGYILYVEPVPYKEYLSVLKQIDPDFALCPLKATAFNLGKSNLRILEMGALGVPCIVSNYGPYEVLEHGETGLKVEPDDKAAWRMAIELLIYQDKTRQDIGHKWYEKVKLEWSWNYDSENRQCWDKIFQEIHAKASEKKQHLVSDSLLSTLP
jgi:glycosyltransferase involved in cell wall biosynthesis